MKKKYVFTFFFILSILINFLLLFRQLDFALEIDDLKSQIELERKDISFLIKITNLSINNCNVGVDKLIDIHADLSGLNQSQYRKKADAGDDSIGIGSFKIYRKDNCVIKIEIVGY